jgi:hypothetical protein
MHLRAQITKNCPRSLRREVTYTRPDILKSGVNFCQID